MNASFVCFMTDKLYILCNRKFCYNLHQQWNQSAICIHVCVTLENMYTISLDQNGLQVYTNKNFVQIFWCLL